jgi:hypothetical protein
MNSKFKDCYDKPSNHYASEAYLAGMKKAYEKSEEICVADPSDDGSSHDRIWNTACLSCAAEIKEKRENL